MTRRLRVPLIGVKSGPVTLDEATSRYVVRAHRGREGTPLCVFDPTTRTEADAVVVDVHPRRARIEVGEPRPTKKGTPLEVTLVMSHAKGTKIDDVVRRATELGVSRIVVASTDRTVARSESPDSRRDRWRKIAVEASRQSGRGDVPELVGPEPFAEAIAGAGAGRRLLLHPEGTRTVDEALAGWVVGEALTLVVGPEGGLSDAERETARALEYQLVTAGPFVLRTETAAVAALGAIAARVRPG